MKTSGFCLVLLLAVNANGRFALAQVVAVRCCAEQADMNQVGVCVSGAGEGELPAGCPIGGRCVIGFGADQEFMSRLCDPGQQVVEQLDRGHCSEWLVGGATVMAECVARAGEGVDLFSVFDDEGDGDFDLLDYSSFENGYGSVPKLQQSDAVLVSVDCCLPEAVLWNLGVCLSGPGETILPLDCALASRCVFGFTEAIELGDFQFELCRNSSTGPEPVLSDACAGWIDDSQPVAFTCRTSPPSGMGLFIVADVDGDADVDLGDFAVFQAEWGEEPIP